MTSAAGRLRERCDELLASIEARGVVPDWARADLAKYLRRRFEGAAGQARSARERSQARAASIAEGIRRARGALPLSRGVAGLVQRRIARKGPSAFGLERVPDLRKIRAALKKSKGHFGSDTFPTGEPLDVACQADIAKGSVHDDAG